MKPRQTISNHVQTISQPLRKSKYFLAFHTFQDRLKISKKFKKHFFEIFENLKKMSICQWFFWKTFFSDYHFHFIRIFRFSKKINSKKSQSGKSRTLKFRCVFKTFWRLGCTFYFLHQRQDTPCMKIASIAYKSQYVK